MGRLIEIEKLLWGWTEKAVNDWFDSQMKNPYSAYYLYYKEEAESIVIATDKPEGYTLGSSERISPAWTKDQAYMRVRNMLNRLPLFNPNAI